MLYHLNLNCVFLINLLLKLIVKEYMLDFPVGPVVKNLPANAGDMGSIPDQGRSHIPRGNQTHVTIESVPWSLGAAVTETRALDRVHCNEKPPRREAAAHLS